MRIAYVLSIHIKRYEYTFYKLMYVCMYEYNVFANHTKYSIRNRYLKSTNTLV